MLSTIISALIFLLTPALVLVLCRKVKLIGKAGPVLTLYIIGAILGNIGLIPGVSIPEETASVQHILSSITVPFAIPLMLIGCTFDRKESGKNMKALLSGLLSVIVAVLLGFLIFGRAIDSSSMSSDGAAKIGGLLAGAYTGGTVNMAALKTMLSVSDSTYLLLNSYNMLIGFFYLVFLVSCGIKLFRAFLKDKSKHEDIVEEESGPENPYKGLGTRKGLGILGILIVLSAVICGLSYLVTLLFPNLPMMTIFILALTTISICFSFVKKISSLPYSYDVGMYSIYVFSMVVASMADIRMLDFAGGLGALGYLAFVVFASLALQALQSYVFKIDADITVITSVAFLCSPPFVPMVSASMRNKRVLAAGLAIGILGYAIGTYLGYGMFRLLS